MMPVNDGGEIKHGTTRMGNHPSKRGLYIESHSWAGWLCPSAIGAVVALQSK